MTFTGFPGEAFDFYEDLAAHNTRAWWTEHKAVYESTVRDPMRALLAELEDEFGGGHVFRPYRDVRFAKDKTPYKDHQGGYVGVEDSIGYYVQVSAAGLMVAGGWYAPLGQQIVRFREAVDSAAGAELERILRVVPKAFTVDGRPLKTRPRGWADDHPRLELLRMRQLTVDRTHGAQAWVSTRGALTRIRRDWRAVRPLVEWLADHVGPATDPREPVR